LRIVRFSATKNFEQNGFESRDCVFDDLSAIFPAFGDYDFTQTKDFSVLVIAQFRAARKSVPSHSHSLAPAEWMDHQGDTSKVIFVGHCNPQLGIL
jgi:hypothetical protein